MFLIRAVHNFAARFARDVSGNVLMITGLTILVLFSVVGFSIDLGKQQLTKAKLQQASDAASLAAASLPQGTPDGTRSNAALRYFNLNFPEVYFGIQRPSPSINVGGGRVSVSATANVPTHFISNIGIDTLEADGRSVVAQNESTTAKYDLILVMDVSGSMHEMDVGFSNFTRPSASAPCIEKACIYGPPMCPNGRIRFCPSDFNQQTANRMNTLRWAAMTMATNVLSADTGSRMAGVTWSDSVITMIPLTEDLEDIQTFLGNMIHTSGTNSTVGLQQAQIYAEDFNDDAVHGVVLLADGTNGAWSNGVIGQMPIITHNTINPQSLAICSQFKNEGTIVYTIGFGQPVINDPVARNFLSQCASAKEEGGRHFYPAPSAQDLSVAFQSITTHIGNLRIIE